MKPQVNLRWQTDCEQVPGLVLVVVLRWFVGTMLRQPAPDDVRLRNGAPMALAVAAQMVFGPPPDRNPLVVVMGVRTP